MENVKHKIEKLIGYLVVNLQNFKKSPNRQYLLNTLKKKRVYCEDISNQANYIIQKFENKLTLEEVEDFQQKLNSLKNQLDNLICEKIKKLEMPPKLDLSLALKLVKPFDGSVTELTRYIESVELLKDYADDVPEATILKFLKTTLIGSAHGTIDGVNTINQAMTELKQKFAIRVTPKAVESEMHCLRQNQKSISDFGCEIEKLTAKLAAAHVSTGTFASEAAASNIVQPIAVEAFIDGLKDPSTKFFLRARNPTTLNKAISDALECTPSTSRSTNETALWCGFQYQGNNGGRNRGFSRGRNFYGGRGRGYSQSFRGRGGSYQNFNGSRGRGFQPQTPQGSGRGFNRGGNHYNNHNNQRGHYNPHAANVAEQTPPPPQQQQPRRNNPTQPVQEEEANLIDLFR